ncbi:hypothetical protein [Methylobacterium gnaphalii]|uniref:Uncharacterized protein n=1 Tax=Methylobacterium gnaphalii TaxID=1010610 RepID=A0A512JPQ0_9HYPH|nr:hypothetical protein [Methylobacterium gnaphalii]GEP11912.1 hypothetical protein MGN01_37570 [Methylobacterium gnaphalii]GJD68468.1 hypothetical protein MMMDOFMJ_1391 [Methylobacterium gnaphalii]GLS51499.1 hypothetical protein GCM10007885_43560 [Methylobacterium gnaphalii]
MPAPRAFSIDFVSGFIQFGAAGSAAEEEAARHTLVRALGPALDTAFGLEHVSLLPDEIRSLADALLAGPLGAGPASIERAPALA